MAYDENIRIIAEELERLKNRPTGDQLPEVETTDEGKVLTVNSSGEWDAEELPDQLPAVETTDEGKVLTVNSSGEWAAADPSSSYDLDYSTTEKNTGMKWIDGKDIYKKTYSKSALGSTNTLIDSTLSSDNANVVKLEYNKVEALSPYNNENFICGHLSDKIFLRIWSKNDGLFANLEGSESTYTCDAIFTVYYTKTTTSKKKGAK